MENSKSLVIKHEKGQTTFRGINPEASPEQLHQLAKALNSLQAEKAGEIAAITTTWF